MISWAQQAFRYEGQPNSMIYNGKAKVAWSEYLAKTKEENKKRTAICLACRANSKIKAAAGLDPGNNKAL